MGQTHPNNKYRNKDSSEPKARFDEERSSAGVKTERLFVHTGQEKLYLKDQKSRKEWEAALLGVVIGTPIVFFCVDNLCEAKLEGLSLNFCEDETFWCLEWVRWRTCWKCKTSAAE